MELLPILCLVLLVLSLLGIYSDNKPKNNIGIIGIKLDSYSWLKLQKQRRIRL